MKNNNYTASETAKFKAQRREATRKFKQELHGRGNFKAPLYPDNVTQSQRGFTPAGSAKLNYPDMVRLDTKLERRSIPRVARKPTIGTKRILQVIKSIKKMSIPARYNIYGELARPELFWNKILTKVIHHTRPLRNQAPLFPKAK